MKKISPLFKWMYGCVLIVLLAACSGNESTEGNTQDALSAFLNNNPSIVAFGNSNLKDILDKTDYENVPKFGMLISSEMKTLEKYLDLSIPVYYALEGPFTEDGPATTYAFLNVINADSLAAELTNRGFDLSDKGDIKFTQDGDFALGIKGKLGIVVTRPTTFEGEKLIVDAFARAEGAVSGGKVEEILETPGDIIMAVNLENLYATSDTDLNKLSKEKQAEVQDMVKGSFVQTVFKFENGAAIVETKNHFSDALMDRMFMKQDDKAPVIAKLGSGAPRFGVAINVDMKKMQSFVDDFSPDATKELARSIGGPAQMALMTAGGDGLASLFDGQMGMVMHGDEAVLNGAEGQLAFYLGLAPKGMDLGSSAKELLSYVMEEVRLDNNGLSGFSSKAIAPGNQPFKLPNGCENFGKSGVSAFMSFEGLKFEEIDLKGEENLLRVIEYITFEYNNDGGRLYIKAVDGKENVLKQFVDEMVDGLAADISNISI